MNKSKLTAVLVLAAASMTAQASDGTITFSGQITDKTCTISTPGGGDFAVNLPTMSMNSLASAGAVAGRTPFSINLSECSSGSVATYFEPGATVDFETGRLNNQASTDAASNVQLQLLGDNSQFLPIKAAGVDVAQDNSQWVTVGEDGSATLNYYAEYYATGTATPGDVSSSIKYTVIYN